jgi:DNA (cytosine-5)-methyltransferase 1
MPDKDNFGAVLQPIAGTLGNRGTRSHTELDGHGAYIPVHIQDGREINKQQNGIGVGQPGDPQFTLQAAHSHAVAIGTDCYNGAITGDVAATMGTPGSSVNASGPTVMQTMTVRRLTPRECERLQGFPDDYTLIPWRKKAADDCPDGPRYKALGNSMAVNVVTWIGERIAAFEAGEDA